MNKNSQNISINNSENVSIGSISFELTTEGTKEDTEKKKFGTIDIEYKTTLKNQLSENKILEVINHLFLLEPDQQISNEIYILKERYNRINSHERLESVEFSIIQIEKNKISSSLLTIIDML